MEVKGISLQTETKEKNNGYTCIKSGRGRPNPISRFGSGSYHSNTRDGHRLSTSRTNTLLDGPLLAADKADTTGFLKDHILLFASSTEN